MSDKDKCPECHEEVELLSDVAKFKVTGKRADNMPTLEAIPVHIPNGMGCLRRQLATAVAELAALQAKLPRDAEGATRNAGDILYFHAGGRVWRFVVQYRACGDPMNGEPGGDWEAVQVWDDGGLNCGYATEVELCYSTEAAAREAGKGQDDG